MVVLLRSARALAEVAAAEQRLLGRGNRDLAQNIQRVLESLGSQLLPAEGPGGREAG